MHQYLVQAIFFALQKLTHGSNHVFMVENYNLCILFIVCYENIWILIDSVGHKKQETEECILKLCGYKYHHGTCTPLWGVKLTPINGKKSCTLFSTRSESIAYLMGTSASKVSLSSLSGDYFKFLISMHSPDFLFFVTGFQE
jgi:hypothetical protein